MRRMLGLVAASCALVAGCSKSDTARTDTTTAPAATPAPAAATPAPTPPVAITLADAAGKWNMRAVPDSGDTSVTTYVLTATPDSSGWKLTFANGLVVPAHAMASGDSIVLRAGPYASVRRKGMQVTTEGVLRRDGDMLKGTTTAHYKTSRPDSVLHLHVEGVKAP